MAGIQLQEYAGKMLTQPEIEFVTFVEGKREILRKTKEEKEFEARLLANSSRAISSVSIAAIKIRF
jgi:hypothetical protein